MTTPLTDQIRDYFADLETQQGAIDVDSLFERESSRPGAVDGFSTHSTQPHARRWAGLVAAAAVVALVAGLAIMRAVADGGPADDVIVPIDDDTSPVTSDSSAVSVPTTETAPSPSVQPVPATDGASTVTASTSPPTTSVAPYGSVVAGHGCPFGIAGDPIVMETGPVDPLSPRFDAEPGQNIAHTVIGSQVAEVRVPGFTLGTEGWRMEDIELARGPAKVWLDGPPSGEQGKPFVQVRWSSDTEETCGSFTVTVDGGTEDANRQLAIDLAQRILLPSELGDPDLPGASGGPLAGLELAGTEWRIASTSNGGPGSAVVVFGDTTVTWEDGCATVSADYDLDREEGILTLANQTSTDPGCTPPLSDFYDDTAFWSDIRAVMGAERIAAVYVLDFPGGTVFEVESLVRLSAKGASIVLAPA